ncbi:MAG: preprotein translocase subunit SecG [Butyricicoccus sp.]|nr:preprotein translocase subunit SecG [Butyricicoccus sp.]
MGVFEVIGGVLLMVCSIAIIVLVLMQSSQGKGLSGAIGGSDMMNREGRSRSATTMMAVYTKYAAIAYFVLAVIVGVISLYVTK